ncbi:hypothetical protein [Sphaerobacter thermophilus]|uniref:YtkA-like domain-containing protein n=1 Tax=Sphaerobacter thermophilus (strain ATCC 49802 / DSM 20745 / KCCM 41009 / NCIMB 13125 / S 6022) TaxID=479434 RepID=D1C161_SPHTD|nr:hypothetical protein [Sphaerobacter thermophilus]ACZ37978.1 hypothetical protein Sthe_0540 [Sphaerobacter thermophilus DSM 20745]PZN63597.1 MAG: hypothetical protein DIU58_10455 [Sphaerobacter thermophilus]
MSNRPASGRGRVTLMIVAAAVLVFAVGVAWMSLGHANDPAYQQRVTLPGMAGQQEYLINLWTDPHPVEQGRTRVTVQLTSTIGTPVPMNDVRFTPVRPDGTSLQAVPASPLPDGNEPEAGLTAVIEFDQPGSWTLITTLNAGGGIEREARFTIPVG